MTQPVQAVGGATNDEPVIAAEPTIEDRFADLTEEEPEAAPEGNELPPDEAPDIEIADIEEADIGDDDLPPIAAPVSWPDEDKQAFSELPRALQERVAARETEREKSTQAKFREASQAAQTAEQKAFDSIRQVQQAHIQQIVSLLPEVPPEPSAHLLVQDPAEYAAQKDYFDQMKAYRGSLEQHIVEVTRAMQVGEQQRIEAARAADVQLLQNEFAELFDQDTGPELAKAIKSTGIALGYSDDQLNMADGHDILALRTAMGWKDKADKYDRLMAKQMEKVRSAKNLPRVSRPGSSTSAQSAANQRYTADRDAMRKGDRNAAIRVFDRFL